MSDTASMWSHVDLSPHSRPQAQPLDPHFLALGLGFFDMGLQTEHQIILLPHLHVTI